MLERIAREEGPEAGHEAAEQMLQAVLAYFALRDPAPHVKHAVTWSIAQTCDRVEAEGVGVA